MKKGFAITSFVFCALCIIIAFFPVMSVTELFKEEIRNSESLIKSTKDAIPNVFRLFLGGKKKFDNGAEIDFSSSVPYGTGFVGLFFCIWLICSFVFLITEGQDKTSGFLMILFNILYVVLFFVIIVTEFNIPKSIVDALGSNTEKPLKSYITFGFGFWGIIFSSVLSAIFGIVSITSEA